MKSKNYTILCCFTSPDGLQYIGCARAQRKRSDRAVIQRKFNDFWRKRRNTSRSPLFRAMDKTNRDDWQIEIIETVSIGAARLRKTQLMAEYQTVEPEGLNAANGFRRIVSKPSRIRKSRETLGVNNPRYVPISLDRIQQVVASTTWNEAARILGVGKGTVARRLRGDFGIGKYSQGF